MPSDPTRPSYTRAQRRLLTALAGLVVAALAGGAYVLTYDALRELALTGGVSRRWAPLYPAMADTLVAMTILSLAVTRNARWWTRLLRWTLLLVLVAGGAAISVQRSVRGLSSMPDDPVRVGVAVAPHVMLVIAIWLWLTMFKQIRVARPAAAEAAPAETQRGHVKVLERAAPPLALEPPAEPEDPEDLIPFPFDPNGPDTQVGGAHRPATQETAEHEAGEEADEQDTVEHEPAARAASRPGPGGYGGSLSSEPAPPLDTLPEPRPPLDSAPALLPTDVELVRSRDRDDAEQRPVASTTRPDIVMPVPPGGDEDLHDAPPADRAEDPDAGDPTAEDWNPPPSGNFRSGPMPPAG
ncbi:DUF2637 domain-containing protein [Actinomadura formosensis]|uniref:DUF2637 domain-containing protein n=1 Tax=Actinomadura formosensis TaxID=60706 RepID=UPI003D8CC53F